MNAAQLDRVISLLRATTADLAADNDAAEKKQKPPRYRTCQHCGHRNEYRVVCWKCGKEL
jgi:hypothetical protein